MVFGAKEENGTGFLLPEVESAALVSVLRSIRGLSESTSFFLRYVFLRDPTSIGEPVRLSLTRLG